MLQLATLSNDTSSKCGSISENARWYVIRSKQRQEPRAAFNLSAHGIETLLPQMPAKNSSKFFHAFFPGYLFARFELFRSFHQVRYSSGVSHVLAFGGEPVPVDDEIIDLIRQRMDHKGFVTNALKLRSGSTVTIKAGPFTQLTGIFEREVSGTERIIVLLNAVSFKAKIDISRFDVQTN